MRASRFLAALALTGCMTAPNAPSAPHPLRLYLARHGQTDWNAQKRLQGRSDVPLNEKGLAQAAELAERLKGVPLDAIYTSSLSRTKQTAAALGPVAPVTALADLDEQALGSFEGAYLDGRDPAVVERWHKRSVDPDDGLDGGESTNQHYERVARAWDAIQKAHPSGQILIVGHGGTNAQLMRAILDLTPEQADQIHQANDELYAIELWPGRPPQVWKLVPADKLTEL